MHYKHLSHKHRIIIAHEIRQGKSLAWIGESIGFSKATISREVNRNCWQGKPYDPERAHNIACRRRAKASGMPRKLKGKLLRELFAKMKAGWSPDAFAGRMGVISTKAIYNYLHREQRKHSHHRPRRYLVRRLDKVFPFCLLKVGLGKYRKRGKPLIQPAMRDATPIRMRPAAANMRAELGHVEVDTAQVKGGSLLFAICRTTRLLFARKLKEKTSREVAKAMTRMLAGYEVKTITSDRGSEFARYRLVEEKTGGEWFACDPRRPDQRGVVECVIRQTRYDYPRRMAAADITPSKLAADIRRLNNTPRKSLGYKTPAEAMAEMMAKATAKQQKKPYRNQTRYNTPPLHFTLQPAE